jgi:pyruvate/2-oxoglutarate dehydrogenase complex dihydrolipoamide dehydrogenase (E3) component
VYGAGEEWPVDADDRTRRLEARHVLVAVGSEPTRPNAGSGPPVVVTSDEQEEGRGGKET